MKSWIFIIFIISNLSATIINIPDGQPTIQAGINVAVEGDTVLVQPGTYVENINYNGKLITVASLFLTTQDTSYISQTTIDGNQNGSVVTFESGEDATAVLCGFTIINGSGNLYSSGGGIDCSYNSSPSLQNLIITGNTASYSGGGIWCYYNSNPYIENVSVTDNSASSGGGISCDSSNPTLVNVIVTGNSAFIMTGGIMCILANPTLVNVIIRGNWAGGIGCVESNPSLINVTISGNSANWFGGGILCTDNSNPSLINCILWNDSPQEIYFLDEEDPNSITIFYSDIQGGEAGIVTNNNGTVNWLEGNIDEVPLFVGTGDHPVMLQDISPCVNAGIPDTTGLNLPEYDLAGNPRVYGGRIDMGAYENQNVVVSTNEALIPLVTKLNQNYPNPFNPITTITFSIPEESKVELSIFNIKGQKIKTLVKDQITVGEHSIIWNSNDELENPISSGVYIYKLNVNGKTEAVKKCLLMK